MDYDSWIEVVFNEWALRKHTDLAELVPTIGPAKLIEFISRVFNNCAVDLARFSDSHVARGLEAIAWTGESDWMNIIFDRSIAWTERMECMRSMATLFKDCFARRCLDFVTSFPDHESLIDVTCFMWWDRFPSRASTPSDPEEGHVNKYLVHVMSDILQIPHNACRRSALHGLGHWEVTDPPRIKRLIDDWLALVGQIPDSLKDYAERARDGQIH